jgi:hypothetical protein
MHAEIADTLLVPGAEPLPLSAPHAEASAEQDAGTVDAGTRGAPEQESTGPAAEAAAQAAAIREKEAEHLIRAASHRRKRRVASLAVLFVVIAVPAIALALFFG